jgi:hypothetical protein
MEDVFRAADHVPCRLAIRAREVPVAAGMDVQFSEPLERGILFQQPVVLSFRVVIVATVVIGLLQGASAGSYDVPDHVAVFADVAEDPHAGLDIDCMHDLVDAFKDPVGEHELTHCFSPCTR